MRLQLVSTARERVSPLYSAFILLASLLAGLVVIGVLFLFKGINPFFAFAKIFTSAFGSVYGIQETVTKAIPLILISAGLTLAFQAKFWNIGANGQLLAGAACSTWIALNLELPPYLVVPAMIGAGFLGGALWAVVPALLKVKFGINEVISTLMFNYIGAEVINYLVIGPWKGKTKFGFPYTDNFPQALWFAPIPGSRIHYLTLVIALILVILLVILKYKTRFGYELRVAGENREAARYAGINYLKVSLLVMIISGGAAGLAGVGEVAGIHHHLTIADQISSGYGFAAIIVAWLARLNPALTFLSGFVFAGVLVGGDALQISLGLPAAAVNVFNGILLIFLIAGEFFKNKVRIEKWN